VFERTRAEAALRLEREALLAEIERRERLEQQRQLLLGELNHRVKNMLAVVLGIAQQTAKSSASVLVFTSSFSGRLASLAKAHSLLTAEVWEAAPLDSLVRELTGTYTSEAEGRVHIEGPPVMLPPRAVLALSLVVHELLTNTIKHGALSVPEGRVLISWALQPSDGADLVRLRWREEGMTGVAEPKHAGFGTRLINASVGHELGGTADFRWLPGGLELELQFPAIEQTERTDMR
jgi:two-component sensor histidine kinase